MVNARNAVAFASSAVEKMPKTRGNEIHKLSHVSRPAERAVRRDYAISHFYTLDVDRLSQGRA